MTKRRTSGNDPKISFAVRTPDPEVWDICRDCIDPLASHFEKMRNEWILGERESVELFNTAHVVEIWWSYAGEIFDEIAEEDYGSRPFPDINFACVWLSVNVSAGFSEEFRTRLRGALDSLSQASLDMERTWELEKEFNPARPATAMMNQLDKLNDEEYDGSNDPKRGGEIWLGLLPSRETRERIKALEQQVDRELAEICKFLRQTQVVLKARDEQREVQKAEVRKARRFDELTDSRDKFIYDRAMEMIPWDKIRADLDRMCVETHWYPISTAQGVRNRAFAYATRHKLPDPPRRQESGS